MTRATQTISFLVAVSAAYLALFLRYVPLPEKIQQEVIPVLPFWALVSFGAYLLLRLGWGVLTFNDVPEAYNELMSQIEHAKKELKAKGVTIDD